MTNTTKVTRSNKANGRDHVALANGTAAPEEHLPRYFAKSGGENIDPRNVKKKGSGKGNWGKDGDELLDFTYNATKPRRRSNSSNTGPNAGVLKTKFETVEPEPVFEEELHGASADDFVGYDLEQSSTGGSVEEEDKADK